jgi:dienelactone hydrolase
VFAKHGYALLYLFRRGSALSAGQGTFMGDALDREVAAKGEAARFPLQLILLTTEQLDDVRAGLAYLRTRPEVDRARIAVSGHSFGGQLALLAAERDDVRAAVTFAAAAQTWDSWPELQKLLLETVAKINVPVFLNYAVNDFSIAPGKSMAAEMAKRQKRYELRIYPPVGKTAGDGHSAVYTDVTSWEREVFPFLDEHLRGRE